MMRTRTAARLAFWPAAIGATCSACGVPIGLYMIHPGLLVVFGSLCGLAIFFPLLSWAIEES